MVSKTKHKGLAVIAAGGQRVAFTETRPGAVRACAGAESGLVGANSETGKELQDEKRSRSSNGRLSSAAVFVW
jgi:hypothetical protein